MTSDQELEQIAEAEMLDREAAHAALPYPSSQIGEFMPFKGEDYTGFEDLHPYEQCILADVQVAVWVGNPYTGDEGTEFNEEDSYIELYVSWGDTDTGGHVKLSDVMRYMVGVDDAEAGIIALRKLQADCEEMVQKLQAQTNSGGLS